MKSWEFVEHDRILPLCVDLSAPRSVMMKRLCADCLAVGLSGSNTGVVTEPGAVTHVVDLARFGQKYRVVSVDASIQVVVDTVGGVCVSIDPSKIRQTKCTMSMGSSSRKNEIRHKTFSFRDVLEVVLREEEDEDDTDEHQEMHEV